MYRKPHCRRPARLFAAVAIAVGGAAAAADPPGSLALDWPMGQQVGGQLVPGQNIRVMQNYANANGDYQYRLHSALDLSLDSGSTSTRRSMPRPTAWCCARSMQTGRAGWW